MKGAAPTGCCPGSQGVAPWSPLGQGQGKSPVGKSLAGPSLTPSPQGLISDFATEATENTGHCRCPPPSCFSEIISFPTGSSTR